MFYLAENLISNGGFEEAVGGGNGPGAPAGWQNGNGGTVWRCHNGNGDRMLDGNSYPRNGQWMAC